MRNPLFEYELPTFLSGRASPILNAQLEELIRRADAELAEQELTGSELEAARARKRELLARSLERGSAPFALAHWKGPVSVNPIGIYENWIARTFVSTADEIGWNSFNAGEFFFAGRRSSLMLLFVLCLPLGGGAVMLARNHDRLLAG